MMGKDYKRLIERGIKAADSLISQEDKIWSKYSRDKVDIGEKLTRIIRTLYKAFPLDKPLEALSIGSSNEPQFRILEASFRGGLYLLDIEKEALDIVSERIHRQALDHVKTIPGDYNNIFLDRQKTILFLKNRLNSHKSNLITLHHSLYYCPQQKWDIIFENLYSRILAPCGAIHAVLMESKSNNQYTTTWLYNHFAGKFCYSYNNQDLCRFKKQLQTNPLFKKAQIFLKEGRVEFFVNNFEEFMSVVWMILLYPDVHRYNQEQKEEITEFIYKKFWLHKRPLVQMQDHLVVYRQIPFRGII